MIHMRIVQGNETVADLPGWPHPVPRKGDYIFHPPLGGGLENIAGCVKTVTWRTHDRAESRFVITAHPYVEIVI
jgi:hypothetical protein